MPERADDLMGLSDQELVLAYRGGRVEAYEELVRRYRQEMFHFLMRFVRSAAAADDLFQETFLQVHLSIETFDTSKRLKPWLFTIGANKARDYLRRNKRRPALSLSASVDGGAGSGGGETAFVDLMEDDLPMPEVSVSDAETADRVRRAVDELPDHLREVLLLAYFRQMAYKEVAEALSIPLGTVKSRLHAAVGSFAQVWKDRYARPGDLEGPTEPEA